MGNKKTNNKEDAEDLTNSVFVAIFEYFNKDINISKLDNLIWKIAHNIWSTRAIKYIKKKNNVNYDVQIDIRYEQNNIDKIIYKEIVYNIDKVGLTEKEINSFRLFYIEDLSIREISKMLVTTESNIKYYLYSARKKIKERYHE